MRTKIVYVLVSSEKDIYLEQARISIASLRTHQKDATIVLMIDSDTKESLNGVRAIIQEEVDEMVVVDAPKTFTPQQRSRMIKTSVRQHIEGDYLFIDCDTIILRPIEEIDTWEIEIGAVYDSHSPFQCNPYRHMSQFHCKLLGCDIEKEEIYFNSGVLYVKDTPRMHDFYMEWNKNWISGLGKDVNMDQPAFAVTNIAFNYPVTPIPAVWNCQIVHGIKFMSSAKILHYLCTNSDNTGDIFILRGRAVFNELKNTGKIPAAVEACFVDVFTGMPDMTHLHGGPIIDVFWTSAWFFLKKLFGTKYFRYFNRIYTELLNQGLFVGKK